jgi:hypothetical protein
MRRHFILGAILLTVACGGKEEPDQVCSDMCSVLVRDCSFAAYPSEASCVEGCLYNQEQGADVAAQLECINDAESCDTFAIAECEHAHGG